MDKTPEEKDTSGSIIEHFATSTLPLFHGPLVKIRIEPSNREYTVSKPLLCNESPVFSAMFKGNFRESQEETATLQEMEGVVSIQSIEALIQWLYLRTINFDIDTRFHELHIVAAVELARLAEMYGITKIEPQLAQYVKGRFAKCGYRHKKIRIGRAVLPDTDDWILGTFLRDGHPVRWIMAQALVFWYLRNENEEYPGFDVAQGCPKFGVDLLHEVRLALNTLKPISSATFKDPITGKRRYLVKGEHDEDMMKMMKVEDEDDEGEEDDE
ncbi:hypothetical protein N7519_000763 [Penicillium mononematosum]|uniref:uncharacterized protein n=1 Tax=Penicillium mononematosum TaxID=268346 RepID=UPI00254894BC|nr:uncharacterized protein N7519_000763 [Penicillium mononematosum]KAJ6190742.1 hypothetical protein N7519_000763 [Penicillium mononematosum]